MPFFDYECTECGSHFEVMHLGDAPPTHECKRCGGSLRRLSTPPSARSRGTGKAHVRGADDVKAPWPQGETEIHRGWKDRRRWKLEALGWSEGKSEDEDEDEDEDEERSC